MATEIIMPKAGMSMESGTIIKWMKAVGDFVDTGEAILEIETDKVAMEVEAESSGYLIGICYESGAVVPVTQTIGWLGEKGEKPPELEMSGAGEAGEEKELEAVPDAMKESRTEEKETNAGFEPRVRATPAARQAAVERGVNLSGVVPTGPSGEVVLRDVSAAAGAAPGTSRRISPAAREEARKKNVPLDGIAGSGSGGRILRKDLAEQAGTTPLWQDSGDTVRSVDAVRRVTAARMMESHLSNPPVTLDTEADASNLLALRSEVNKMRKKRGAPVFSLNTWLMKAVAAAVRGCPWMRGGISGDTIVEHHRVNLGMAVSTPLGLMVPVIQDADEKSLTALHAAIEDLKKRASERRLGLDDMQGATFTVSNLGMYGITHFTPIINPPESAILGVGTIKKELYQKEDGSLGEKSLLCLSLTIDHKLIDGAEGALFVRTLSEILGEPLQLLV